MVPVRHLAPLFDNPKLDKELRAMLREKFPEFCSSPSPPVEGRGFSHVITYFKRGMETFGLSNESPCLGDTPVHLSASVIVHSFLFPYFSLTHVYVLLGSPSPSNFKKSFH